MDPVTLAVLRALADEMASIAVKTSIQYLRLHAADPAFQKKAEDWAKADTIAREGGSLDDIAKSNADLRALIGG